MCNNLLGILCSWFKIMHTSPVLKTQFFVFFHIVMNKTCKTKFTDAFFILIGFYGLCFLIEHINLVYLR